MNDRDRLTREEIRAVADRITGFWEYEGVQRKTRDLEALRELHSIRLSEPRARELIETLCYLFKLRIPKVRFTGWTDRGKYEYDGSIILRKSSIAAEVVCHELAHHWLWTKVVGPATSHGEDFTLRLDKLAAEALEVVRVWERDGLATRVRV